VTPDDFPALYRDADRASSAAQRVYLNSLRAEYLLLIAASAFSLNLAGTRLYFAGYALVFLLLIGIVGYRTLARPEQRWYRARALAESVKTAAWRFMMRAPPFDGAELPRREFSKYLQAILQANQHIGAALAEMSASGNQVTAAMEATRDLPLAERRQAYLERRIKDQRGWYVERARQSRRTFRYWIALLVALYGLGTAAALTRVAWPEIGWLALDPLIVLAAAVVGWIQVKKFSELAAAYALTAHEIAIVETRAEDVTSEAEFSDFVNEAELAFSREHTQWVARQQNP